MGLADYHDRGAQAVSQIVSGFDETQFRELVSRLEIGLSIGSDVEASSEGVEVADLLVRLLARFYPSISIEGPFRDDLIELARAINPAIEVTTARRPSIGIVVGTGARPFRRSVFVGSAGWQGFAGTSEPIAVGDSHDPFGAGVAACLGAGILFRMAVLGERHRGSTESLDASTSPQPREPSPSFDAVLVGCGAIGNATVWAMSRLPDSGRLDLVDPEQVELSNLQRYVLTERADEGAKKVRLASLSLKGSIVGRPFVGDWRAYLASRGFRHDLVAIALDSAEDRRAVQASLPRLTLNAWTQPGDLGVSSHGTFGSSAACVCCLYFPAQGSDNEDEIYARALRIPERVVEVRTLLFHGGPVGNDFVAAVADALGQPRDLLEPFADRSIRELYVRGICGGAVLPLGAAGRVRAEVHVPLAHQSALAGVLLAARVTEVARGALPVTTDVTQIDVLRPVPPFPTHQVTGREGCICRDEDFQSVHRSKWAAGPRPSSLAPTKTTAEDSHRPS